MIEMFENFAFTVLSFLHNCSLFQEQNFKPVRAATNQSKSFMSAVRISYLLGCKIEGKTFKNCHSGILEREKIQRLVRAVPLTPWLTVPPKLQPWCDDTVCRG